MEFATDSGQAGFVRVEVDDELLFADPYVRRFWVYSMSCRSELGLSERSKFDPSHIVAILPFLWILDVDHGANTLRYRLVGTKMVDAVGFEPTGQTLDSIVKGLDDSVAAAILERYWASVREGVATWHRGAARQWRHAKWTTVESLCVPYSTGEARASQLIGISVRFGNEGQKLD